MLKTVEELKRYTVQATDGDVGSVAEFYFDDDNWTVRYLVVDTGSWLLGRKVLISPLALGTVDWNSQVLRVNMNKQRVENSPDIETDKPVSRQYEMNFYDYYGYPYYWTGPYLWGPFYYPAAYPGYGAAGPSPVEKEIAAARQQQTDVHLRSSEEVINYYIEASDGDIGHVKDFLIDDESWTIRYLVIDTRNWWPGKKVLVSPEWIRSVSWRDSKVHVDLSREDIKTAPEYDEHAPPSRDYEKRLYDHYGRQDYWRE